MTSTDWRWQFEPEGGAPFEVTVTATHILHRSADGLRIVFYRSGDVTQLLRRVGWSAESEDSTP